MNRDLDEWARVAGVAVVAALAALVAGSLAADPIVLSPGTTLTRQLEEQATHVYRTELDGGAWRLVLRQQGAGTVATVLVDGQRLGPFDGPMDRQGLETVLLVLDTGGEVGFEITPARQYTGRYQITLERPSSELIAAELAATEAGRAQAAGDRQAASEHYRRALSLLPRDNVAERARILGHLAIFESRDQPRRAIELHRQALGLWRSFGDEELSAVTLNFLGVLLNSVGEIEQAQEVLRQALDFWRRAGDLGAELTTRTNLCLSLQRLGAFADARSCYEQIVSLARESGETFREYAAKANLTGIYWKLGYPDLALPLHDDVLRWARAQGLAFREALGLHNRALLLVELGELETAISDFEQALEIFRRIENRRGQGLTFSQLGKAYLTLGECDRAWSMAEQAVPLRRAAEGALAEIEALLVLGQSAACGEHWLQALDAYGRALALIQPTDLRRQAAARGLLGEVYAVQDALPRAVMELEKAAEMHADLGDRRLRAKALLELGEVRHRMREPARALAAFDEALGLLRDIRDQAEQTRALEARARLLRDLGRAEEAMADVTTAVGLLAELRTRSGGLRQRSAFIATRRGVYELYIQLLMARHRADPQAGHDRRAFAVSEQARSRTLLDALAEQDRALDDEQRRALSDASHRLTAMIERQMRILGGQPDDAEVAATDRQVYDALGALERLRVEFRRQGVEGAAQVETVGVEGAQALLDEKTLLLEIVLGDEASTMWLLGRDSFHSFELAARGELEALARQAHHDLSAVDLRTGRTPHEALARLGGLLLAPLAEPLAGAERLAIVADGALHYVPFAALPGAAGEPLVASHEIVYLPSATALAVQRRRGTGRSNGTLAIFADPVFRDASVASASPSSRAADDSVLLRAGLDGLVRLPATRAEAQAIADLVPPASRLLALGLDAHRDRVLGDQLLGYRFVHFATHGLLNARHPELSGIVLSQVDAEGAARSGFLSMDDIYDLDLDAELVVLSGCRTALGREVRGEGLVGLGTGFMAAGAARVAASLWPVQDQAAAELMSRFYRAMLEQQQAPGAALRSAARSIRQQRRWSDPHFWAAFVLIGDWR